MGCGGSKVDDLPLVTLCRERKDFIKAASDHRYALAAAHLCYFHSLTNIGDALRRFVDEELVIGSLSPSSPLLTLPSNQGKKTKKRVNTNDSSSSTSISHSVPPDHNPAEEEENIADSHLHLSSDSELGSSSGHIHIHDSSPEEQGHSPSPPPFSYAYPPTSWGPPGVNSYMYYMKRSGTPIQTVVQEDPEMHHSSYGYSPYGDGYGGFFGYPPMGSPVNDSQSNQQRSTPPPPPSPPRVSTWDFLNVFDTYDNAGYSGYYPQTRYRFGSTTSSPDSKEVREREGIPDLEDETEQEVVVKEVHKEKKLNEDANVNLNKNRTAGEGTSRAVPSHGSGSSSTIPLNSSHSSQSNSAQGKEIKSSPDTIVSEEGSSRKKGVSFGVDEASHAMDGESSKLSSLTTLSTHGTRDLKEVVKEIRDEFETASSYGKEVALLLEVGKLPYQSTGTALKVIFSRIRYLVVPSKFSSHAPSRVSVRLSSGTMKMAKAYYGESGKDFNMKSGNLSSTLDKLYAWEKKLYKEVKDEERLRASYEKKCKRLKILDDQGAESSKIDATRASIRKLLTKINVCIRAVDAISSRINKLRDEELQPQLTQLIHGLIRMWKCMLKCHQKQFQAIMESKSRSLKANAGIRRDSGRIGAPLIFITCNDWYQAMVRISERRVANALHEFALSLHQLWEWQDEEQRRRFKAEYLSKDFEKQLRTLRMEMGRMELDHDAVSDKTAVSKVPSESGVSPLDDLTVDLDSMRKRLYEERARHNATVKLVHDAASNSLQGGLVPIFEALENFTSEALKAHEQVRLQNAGGS